MMRYNILRAINYLCIASAIACSSCSTTPSAKEEKKSSIVIKMDSLYIQAAEHASKGRFEKATVIAKRGLELAIYNKNDSMISKFCAPIETFFDFRDPPRLDSSDYYNQLRTKHAILSGNKKLLFSALEYKEKKHYMYGRYDSAITVINQRLEIVKDLKDSVSMMDMEYKLGLTYKRLENQNMAFQHYNTAMDMYPVLKEKYKNDTISKKARDLRFLYIVLLYDFADLFMDQKNYKKTLAYYQELNHLIPESRKPHNPTLFLGMAQCYEGMQEPDSAMKYYQIAIEFSGAGHYFREINLAAYHKYGSILAKKGRLKEGEKNLKRASEIAWQVNKPARIMETQLAWGEFYLIKKIWEQASDSLQAAAAVAKKINNIGGQAIVYDKLSQLSEDRGDFKSAFQYRELSRSYQDSLQIEKTTRALTEMDAKYQTYKNQQQIALLQKDNRIQQLQLEANRRMRIFYVLGIAALLAIFYIIYYYRQKQQGIRLNKIKGELENKALRARMNPHFIFNCLNAIQELIITENYTSSYNYLSKFSRLLRMLLHNSEKNFISLNQEIEMCRLCLELESLRFKHSFHYTIDIDKRIDADAILFPCLLLQPLIENAIWHGLLPKEGSKLLNIRFAEENGFLICAITDNGVGREKAAAIKSGKMDIHHSPSKGISLVKQRLAVIETGTSSSATLDIEDHKDPEGTTVNIRLSIPQS